MAAKLAPAPVLVRGRIVGRILAAAFLALAAVLLARQYYNSRSAAPPADSESSTAWYCHQCQSGFALTPDEYQRAVTAQPAVGRDGRPDPLRRSVAVVKCPTCGRPAVQAYRCVTDGIIFDPRSSTGGRPHGCPRCGWNPLTR